MLSRGARARVRFLLPPALLCLLLGVEVVWLASRHYSKAWFDRVDLDEARAADTSLTLRGQSWDPALYRRSAALAPFAELATAQCPGRTGLALTTCLASYLAARFPHGSPRGELFDRDFDPVAVMRSHMGGEPGHCVSRSGIVVAALLATGVPARMVQLLPELPDRGHNALEVWEAGKWVFFDPTYGGIVTTASGARSAAAITAASAGELRWQQLSPRPAALEPHPQDWAGLYARPSTRFVHVVYPEPWLYTRVGTKQAWGPFNGRFIVAGAPVLHLTLGHTLLHAAILATVAAIACWFLHFVRIQWLRRRGARTSFRAAALSED